MARGQQAIESYLEKIRSLDFIDKVELSKDHPGQNGRSEAFLTLETPKGKFTFLVEQKSSYLDRSSLNAFISQAQHYVQRQRKPLLLLTRYMPRPSAERLIELGINFVDQAGNMHLGLGNTYVRTLVGNKERAGAKANTGLTPAKVQVLFTFAIHKEAGGWTVRDVANASGVSKSNVAKIRGQLVDQGLLRRAASRFQLIEPSQLEDQLLRGYETILRPKLLINRYRAPESLPEQLIERIDNAAKDLSLKWSLTGGPAAYQLQQFYKGLEVPVFVEAVSEELSRKLRLIPDAKGPLSFLQSMGTLPYWKEVREKMVAHPWLIYSELMYSSDPRAHEAAQEIKREFLSNG